MPAKNQISRFDKKLGCMVDVTPEADKAVVEELQRDARRIRKGLKTASVQKTGKYPYESDTMAVDPEDIPKAREILKAHGVSTEYTKTGEPIIESRGHFLRHMRAMGFYERNGTTSPRNR